MRSNGYRVMLPSIIHHVSKKDQVHVQYVVEWQYLLPCSRFSLLRRRSVPTLSDGSIASFPMAPSEARVRFSWWSSYVFTLFSIMHGEISSVFEYVEGSEH